MTDLTVGQLMAISGALRSLEEKAKKPCTENGSTDEFIGLYCVFRTYSAGVHTGILTARSGREAIIGDSRRIWSWDGAASLSQLAVSGVTAPEGCKFSVPVEKLLLTEVIEIIPCTPEAEANIRNVAEWKR